MCCIDDFIEVMDVSGRESNIVCVVCITPVDVVNLTERAKERYDRLNKETKESKSYVLSVEKRKALLRNEALYTIKRESSRERARVG